MTSPVPIGLVRFDSATAMAQGLAHCLAGRPFTVMGGAWWHPPVAALVNGLPASLRDVAYILGGYVEAAPHRLADRIDADKIAAWLTALYPVHRFPAIAVGSSNGAFVHLCAAMGIPWLPQTVLSTVRHRGVDPDDARQGLAVDGPVGGRIAANNPTVVVHQLHDPNQDRLMMRTMAYYRLKYRVLPAAYRQFLGQRLAAGGTILVCECTASWPTTRVGERQVFQFGAFGGATLRDYFEGGPRVRDYLRRYGSARQAWDPPPPDGDSPEAEWGFEPALADDVAAIARECGAGLVRVVFDDPEDLSIPVAETYRAWYRGQGRDDGHLLAETFIMMEPHLTLRMGAVPLWLVFNTEPSARTLCRYLDQSDPYDIIDLTLFSHGTEGVGVTPAAEWQELVRRARRQGRLAGVSPSRYPRDFATFTRYHAELSRRPPSGSPLAPLPLARAMDLLRAFGPAHGVAVVEEG